MSVRRIRPTGLHRSLALLATAALIGGCAGASVDGPGATRPSSAGIAQTPRVLRIGSGDKLKISIFGEPELSGAFDVTAQGNIAMPLVGNIPARGLTVEELRVALVRRLSEGYLKTPKVTVEVLNYRPIYIHGEVRSGGEFQFKHGMSLRDAVAMAGGYTYRANTGYVLMTRDGAPGEIRIDLPTDEAVMPGDNIRIPERFF